MGALVEEAIRGASQALTDHDAGLALEIIKADASSTTPSARCPG